MTTKYQRAVFGSLAGFLIFGGLLFFVPPEASAVSADGSLIVDNRGTVYLITGGQRRAFPSIEAFFSHGYQFNEISSASPEDLTLTQGPLMAYADGTLVKGLDATVWIIENGQKRGFTSADAFLGLGYSFNNLVQDSGNVLSSTPEGQIVGSAVSAHPAGSLINDNGTIYLVTPTGRQGVPSPDVFYSHGYDFVKVVPANNADRNLPILQILPPRVRQLPPPTTPTPPSGLPITQPPPTPPGTIPITQPAPTAFVLGRILPIGINSTSINAIVGQTISYIWNSTSGASATSYYTIDSPDTCPGHGGSTGPHTWSANSLSGSATAEVPACQAGHTYTITYRVISADGRTVTASPVVVRVKSTDQTDTTKPDIAIVNGEISPKLSNFTNAIEVNKEAVVKVTVKNQGLGVSPMPEFVIDHKGGLGPYLINANIPENTCVSLTQLSPNQSCYYAFKVAYSQLSTEINYGSIQVTADYANLIVESNESNNWMVLNFDVRNTIPTPKLLSITPGSGPAGTKVTIKGIDLSLTGQSTFIRFGSENANYGLGGTTSFQGVVVPNLSPGVYKVTLNVGSYTTNALEFTVTSSSTDPAGGYLSITTSSMPEGVAGQAYSLQFYAVGGNVPYKWETYSTTHPCCYVGINPSTGLFGSTLAGGLPPLAGTWQIGIKITAADGQVSSKLYNWVVNPAPVNSPPTTAPVVNANVSGVTSNSISLTGSYSSATAATERFFQYGTSSALGSSIQGQSGSTSNSFNATLTGLQPNTTYYFRAGVKNSVTVGYSAIQNVETSAAVTTSNSLPSFPAMTLGPTNNTVQVNTFQQFKFVSTDSNNDTLTYTINMGDGSASGTLTNPSGQAVSTTYKWSVAGTYTITVSVNDGKGGTSSNTFTVKVVNSTTTALQISTTSIPGGTVGQIYSYQIKATGGTAPYKWQLNSASPSNYQCCYLVVDSSTGTFRSAGSIPSSGAGSFTVGIRVTDATGQSASKFFSWKVAAASPPTAALYGRILPIGVNSSSLTTYVGDDLAYTWSSTNGASATSYYTINSPDNCSGHAGSTGPHNWVANSLSGSTTAKVPSCQAGRTYTITYKVTGTNGQSVSSVLIVKVMPLVLGVSDPSFVGPDLTSAGSLELFTGTSHNSEGMITYTIDWGDGTADQQNRYAGQDYSFAHSWATPGVYSIRAMVTNELGYTQEIIQGITVF